MFEDKYILSSFFFVHLGLDDIRKVVKSLDFRVFITINNFWA